MDAARFRFDLKVHNSSSQYSSEITIRNNGSHNLICLYALVPSLKKELTLANDTI
jgi:hypothetical protein